MPFAQIKYQVRTFRFRVMAWLFIVVVGLMILTPVLVPAIVRRSLYDDFDRQLEAEADEALLTLQDLLPTGLPPPDQQDPRMDQLKHVLQRRALSREYLGWFVRLYDGRGQEVFRTDAIPETLINVPPPIRSLTERHFAEEGSFRWVQAPFPNLQEAWLWIQVGRSRDSLIEDVDLLNWTLALRGVFLLFLAPIGGYFLARQVTGPLATIIGTAARLQPQNLSERLPIRGTGDELDQLSATINGMLDRIAEYIDNNRAFVANAAHELRSPLTAIRSSVDVALSRERNSEEYIAVLGDLHDEVVWLSSMVNRLLLLAESDAGRLVTGHQRARLDKVVREAIDMFHPVAESKEVELGADELAAVEVAGDESNLRHIVRNLIDNAIKFSPPHSKVKVRLRADPRRAVFEVHDVGEGIPPEDLPRIFERFFRGDKSRHRDSRAGTGLGLSICRAIVTAMHGEIQVQSSPGQGSTFKVFLPLAP